MIKEEKKTVTEEKYVVTEAVCDRCGASLYDEELNKKKKFQHSTEVLLPGTFKYVGQFYCRYDEDWVANLCDDCSLAVFDFINAGDGPSCQIDDMWNMGPASDEDWADWAPFDPDKVSYTGESKCYYHKEEPLRFVKEGLVCSVKGCPYKVEYIPKDSLTEK